MEAARLEVGVLMPVLAAVGGMVAVTMLLRQGRRGDAE
jgi:hypothetical protein